MDVNGNSFSERKATYGQEITGFIRLHDDFELGAVHPSEEACVADKEDGMDTSGKHDDDPRLSTRKPAGVMLLSLISERTVTAMTMSLSCPWRPIHGVDANDLH
jgi:hypothetical protein